MKTLWTEVSIKLDQQKTLTDSLIIQMTQLKYRSRLNKIYIPEVAGTIVCFMAIVYLLANFEKLNSGYILAGTIATILIMLVLPILSLRAICKMRAVNIAKDSYKDMLTAYTKSRIGFMQVQKASLFFTPVMMLSCIPIANKLMHIPAITNGQIILYIGFIPVYIIAVRWVYKCYDKSTTKMGELLKELGE